MLKKSGFITICGRPNAGKSSLLNNLLGSKLAEVSPKAQMTRDRIQGIYNDDEKGQIIFIDTPGVHNAREGGLNECLVRSASLAIQKDADLVWHLIDPNSKLEIEIPVFELIAKGKHPTFLVFTKQDLVQTTPPQALVYAEKAKELGIEVVGVFFISVKQNKKVISDLLDKSWELLKEGEPFFGETDSLSDRPIKFFVAEKIRSQLYRHLGEELPYSTAVKIDSYKEAKPLSRIEARIIVERESQKGMVIGAKGLKIKEIGSAARAEIEHFLGQKIYLGLKVDVMENWTSDKKKLEKLGFWVS
jgi:GTP-binding protein Era